MYKRIMTSPDFTPFDGDLTQEAPNRLPCDLDTSNAIRALVVKGSSNKVIAERLNIEWPLFCYWLEHYPGFRNLLTIPREVANAEVERALYRRAIGYNYKKEKAFVAQKTGEIVKTKVREHLPPSEQAIAFWLTNRDKENWQQKSVVENKITLEALVEESMKTIDGVVEPPADPGQPTVGDGQEIVLEQLDMFDKAAEQGA